MEHRRNFVLERIEQQGACSYQELADALGVSTMTVRRDADALVEKGLVIKTLGGIQRANAAASLYESAIHARVAKNRKEKRLIAAAALEYISPGQTLFIDGGTTCLELARLIAEHRTGLTVVTNSSLVCLELGRGAGNMIVGMGGQYDPSSASFVGPTGEDEASKFFVDLTFMSTKGFVAREGSFESSVATFRIKQVIAAQCAKLILLVDHTKFGQRALSKVLDIKQIHTVVTDGRSPKADLAELRRRGVEVCVAQAVQTTPTTGGKRGD